jgi:two-component system chemotaxis sensor kinase CheA
VDLAKYRNLFIEEATEHLAEMSRALLALEKDAADGEAIDLVFRMAHSIKGMAGSLDYESVTELAHRLEDRMAAYRAAGRVDPGDGLAALFRGLEGLERMVTAVRETGEAPQADPELLAVVALPETESAPSEATPPKKA